MDRRNFLRMGSLAVLGSLAAPSLALPDTVRGALGGTDNKSAVAAAMNHFGVTEADLKKVLTAALEKGGDYADLYFEHSFNNAVALMDGKVNNCMYRPDMLQEYLKQEEARKLLLQDGYNIDGSLDEMIARLKERFFHKTEFPHEIGLFLGYPIEDVKGFRKFGGSGCIT